MKRLVYFVTGLCCLGGITACEEQMEPVPSGGEAQMVEVSLSVDFAPETDAYTLTNPTKASGVTKEGAFNARLVPDKPTKSVGGSVPDALYNLEIRQYEANGNYVSSSGTLITKANIGQKISIPLSVKDNCQLVLVAWGDGNSSPRLNSNALSAVRKLAVTSSCLTTSPSSTEINQMPYVLHVKDVKVVADGADASKGIIQSIPGDDTDVRLRLKRLAAKLTIRKPIYNVTINSEQYELQQIQLQGIPTNFTILPDPDENGYYPSLLDQFKTVVLSGSDLNAEYSCWMPANVRGTNPAASSDIYRTKANAPDGSSFIQFVSVNKSDPKKKLNYRVYIGGNSSTDFNMCENTDYAYTVQFTHTDLPVNDGRVTIVDPIPASENNNNFVETANCFMVEPGGAFCFNPYKFYQNGTRIENTVLQGSAWCNVSGSTITTPIKSVRVLWQTKENGDVGEPVLGVANASDDHTNIVDLRNGTDLENARIYCRVAPNTAGGSGVIAAYSGENGKGDILWSWHIWVTEYNPDPTGDETVLEPENKRKQKYTYRTDISQYPIMDRNLGAKAGYTDVPGTELERAKANGLHYQWGRKDPFPGSFSEKKLQSVTILAEEPTVGLLNQYGPDGIKFYPRERGTESKNIREVYKHPNTFYYNNKYQWTSEYNESFFKNQWNTTDDKKNMHDPCPVGWRVASYRNYLHLFTATNYAGSAKTITEKQPLNIKNLSTMAQDGGAVLFYEHADNGKTSYFRLTGYQQLANQFNYIGKMCNLWCREKGSDNSHAWTFVLNFGGYGSATAYNLSNDWNNPDAHNIRCIQEKE